MDMCENKICVFMPLKKLRKQPENPLVMVSYDRKCERGTTFSPIG